MSLSEPEFRALRQQAEAGDAAAQHDLGLRMLGSANAPDDAQRAAAWIETAAAQGHARALHLSAVFAAAGFHREVDWPTAMRLSARAAAAGDTMAQEELALLGPAETFDPTAWMDPAPSVQVRIRPRIETFSNFIPSAWLEWITGRSRPALEETKIYAASGLEKARTRSNTGTGFAIEQSDLVLQLTDARIARAIDVPVDQQEPTNVLHYEPGQEFLPHYDFLDPSVASAARDIQVNGQRIATFLIFLNDGFDGGETDFPRLGFRFKGKAGDAIAFWNVTADGAPDQSTLHAGLPPTSGEKWLLSKWVRDRPYALR